MLNLCSIVLNLFYRVKMREGCGVQDHIGRLNQLVAGLQDAGQSVTISDQKAVLLLSLPQDGLNAQCI